LGLAVAVLPLAASSQACERKYVVEDRTTSSIIAFFYETGDDEWSSNLLASVISPGNKQMVTIVGTGTSQYKVVLSGGHAVLGQTSDICALSQIVIFQDGGSSRMVVR